MVDRAKQSLDQDSAPLPNAPQMDNPSLSGVVPAESTSPSLAPTTAAFSNAGQGQSDRALPMIPGYVMGREIARGGMGRVFAGLDTVLGRDVAIKMVIGSVSDEVMRRFITEAKITSRLTHPGIPPVYALGQLDDGTPYLAMKLVRGKTLAEIFNDSTSSPNLSSLLVIFEQICQAVGFAHAQGILHRDLKPANAMVGLLGDVQVMDWGLAKDTSTEEDPLLAVYRAANSEASIEPSGFHQTRMGTIMGTPAYMAPEQARGEQVSTQADVFSLGSILATILTGKPAFVAESSLATIQLVAAGDLRAINDRLDQSLADPELIALARQCLAKRPEDRMTDARQLAEAIASYRANVESRLKQAREEALESRVREAERDKRRTLWHWAIGSVLAVLAIGATGTSYGMFQANRALNDLSEQQNKTQAALKLVTEEKQQTGIALDKLQASRLRNVRHLRTITEDLVETRVDASKSLSETNRALINGLLPLWQEVAIAQDDSAEEMNLQAEGHYRVARLQEWLGEREAAEEGFKQALQLQSQLAQRFAERNDFVQSLAQTHNSYAILLRDLGALGLAEENYRAALTLMTQLVERDPESSSFRQDLAGWNNNLARLLARYDRMEQAIELMSGSLDQRQELVRQQPGNSNYLRDLAESFNNRGMMHLSQNDFVNTAIDFEQALGIRQRLHEQYPENTEFTLLLANSYNNAAVLAYNQGDNDVAIEMLRHAVDLKTDLATQHPAVPKYREDLATAAMNLAGVMAAEHRFDEGIQMFELARKEADELRSNYPEVPNYRSLLGMTLNSLASLQIEQGSYDQVKATLNECLNVRVQLSRDYPEDATYREFIPATYISLAIVSARQFQAAEAGMKLPFGEQAIAHLRLAIDTGLSNPHELSSNSDLEPLMSFAGFKELIDQINQEPR